MNIRPYAIQILKQLSEVCEVMVFTASHNCYAEKVIEKIDPNRRFISEVLYREKCVFMEEGVYVKDIRVVSRRLEEVVLVDNATYSFGKWIENGIPILPFYESREDDELKDLYDFLVEEVLPARDVREVLGRRLRVREWGKYMSARNAIEKLYM